jgi:hypothetical protein
MNSGYLRFSNHCNQGIQSPADVILIYVVTGFTCCKGKRCAFFFIEGSVTWYLQQSVTFQRPVGLFCDIEEVHLSIFDQVQCLGCQFCHSHLLSELQNGWTRVACHTIVTFFELLRSPFHVTSPTVAVCSRHKSAKEKDYRHVYLDEMGG